MARGRSVTYSFPDSMSPFLRNSRHFFGFCFRAPSDSGAPAANMIWTKKREMLKYYGRVLFYWPEEESAAETLPESQKYTLLFLVALIFFVPFPRISDTKSSSNRILWHPADTLTLVYVILITKIFIKLRIVWWVTQWEGSRRSGEPLMESPLHAL